MADGTYRLKRHALPDVRDTPLDCDNAAASSTDANPRWRNWDEDYARLSWTRDTPSLPGGVQHMSASDVSLSFHLMSHPARTHLARCLRGGSQVSVMGKWTESPPWEDAVAKPAAAPRAVTKIVTLQNLLSIPKP